MMGNNQDFAVSGGIGLIASRINVEGPLQKDNPPFWYLPENLCRCIP
jgi:hypothetical protein